MMKMTFLCDFYRLDMHCSRMDSKFKGNTKED